MKINKKLWLSIALLCVYNEQMTMDKKLQTKEKIAIAVNPQPSVYAQVERLQKEGLMYDENIFKEDLWDMVANNLDRESLKNIFYDGNEYRLRNNDENKNMVRYMKDYLKKNKGYQSWFFGGGRSFENISIMDARKAFIDYLIYTAMKKSGHYNLNDKKDEFSEFTKFKKGEIHRKLSGLDPNLYPSSFAFSWKGGVEGGIEQVRHDLQDGAGAFVDKDTKQLSQALITQAIEEIIADDISVELKRQVREMTKDN